MNGAHGKQQERQAGMSIRKQVGERKTIFTVGELQLFIKDLPEDMPIDIGVGNPIEICVMKDQDTQKHNLQMDEE